MVTVSFGIEIKVVLTVIINVYSSSAVTNLVSSKMYIHV